MKTHNNNIIIGTAQFTKNYGINNTNSHFKNKFEYLDEIFKLGCSGIDTALNYGNAQKTIGLWLKNNNYKMKIYTKISDTQTDLSALDNIFKKCLVELNLKKIEGLLMHNQNDWHKKEVQSFANKILKNNLVNSFGLSIYNKSSIPVHPNIKILQIPGSIFNQEILTSKELRSYIESGGEVHVRSVFVQGIIFMKKTNIPKYLSELVQPIKLFQHLAKEANADPISLAIQSVYKLCPTCKLVLGANNIVQLQELVKKSKNYIENSVIEEALQIGSKFPHKLWDPRFWKK